MYCTLRPVLSFATSLSVTTSSLNRSFLSVLPITRSRLADHAVGTSSQGLEYGIESRGRIVLGFWGFDGKH